jgi:hypothetical protein
MALVDTLIFTLRRDADSASRARATVVLVDVSADEARGGLEEWRPFRSRCSRS